MLGGSAVAITLRGSRQPDGERGTKLGRISCQIERVEAPRRAPARTSLAVRIVRSSTIEHAAAMAFTRSQDAAISSAVTPLQERGAGEMKLGRRQWPAPCAMLLARTNNGLVHRSDPGSTTSDGSRSNHQGSAILEGRNFMIVAVVSVGHGASGRIHGA